MSTPIQQAEVSPDDPKYYAPPRWRSGEMGAPPIQPSSRAAELPSSHASTDWTSRHGDMSLTHAFPKPRQRSDEHEFSGVRMTAFASAVGVVTWIWIAFCITTGLARLDTTNVGQLRSGLLSANDPEITLNERLQEANTAIHKVSRPVIAPTLAVADVTGAVNAALPLAIKVTNYTPNTTINLAGLVGGTTLSAGTDAGEGQWRVAIDDLPNTRVIPPPQYVGPMTIVAELRSANDQAIVRTSVRLAWRPAAADSTEAVEPSPSAPPPSVVDNATPKQPPFEQLLARQDRVDGPPAAGDQVSETCIQHDKGKHFQKSGCCEEAPAQESVIRARTAALR